MTEAEFAEEVKNLLKTTLPDGCEIDTKKSLLYSLSFDEQGKLQLGLNDDGEPVRGGGTGFEQDILVFEKVGRTPSDTSTSIVPRVITEVKLERVTTHDAITYSEKARRIRTIYPFVRYGLILGQMDKIPGRVLRLGQEFDFITVISHPIPAEMIQKLFAEEVQASKNLGAILSGKKKVTSLFRKIDVKEKVS